MGILPCYTIGKKALAELVNAGERMRMRWKAMVLKGRMGNGLSQEGLKSIAMLSMALDHGAMVLGGSLWLRVVGRLAFPIYAFLLAEGVRHTRNGRRYLTRLLLAALVSEPVYDWVLYPGVSPWMHQNVLWTLLLGCGMLLCMSKTESPVGKLLWVVLFSLTAQLARASYGGNGIWMIALFGLTQGQALPQWLGLIAINWLMGGVAVSLCGMDLPIQLFALLAMVPIGMYSGEKRTSGRALSRAFYGFYPVHLIVLYLMKLAIQ